MKRELRVFVFRNLHHKGVVYSVRDTRGITIMHTHGVVLKDVQFVVQKGGRDRVRATGRKTVHAGLRGNIVIDPEEASNICKIASGSESVYYNPYRVDSFVKQDGAPIFSAKYAYLTACGDSPRVYYAL